MSDNTPTDPGQDRTLTREEALIRASDFGIRNGFELIEVARYLRGEI